MFKEAGEIPVLCRNCYSQKTSNFKVSRAGEIMANNERVILQFIDTWRENPQRLRPELGSLSNETHRVPDSFHYLSSPEGLRDLETGDLVKEIIDKETSLGKTEFKFFEALESWEKENEKGTSLWLSSPYSSKYPCSKAIFFKISYTWDGQKVLTNSAVLFDATSAETLEIATKISQRKFDNPEVLRESLFVLEDDSVELELLKIFFKYSKPDQISDDYIKKHIGLFERMIMEGTDSYLIYEEMRKTGFIGNHSISCPGGKLTFGEHTLSHSQIINSSESRTACNKCGGMDNVVCGICKNCAKHLEHPA